MYVGSVDLPLEFENSACEICGKVNADWIFFHFLMDGVWRKLVNGKTLRQQGFDSEEEVTRVYVIHSCAENIICGFDSIRDVTIFVMSLREK